MAEENPPGSAHEPGAHEFSTVASETLYVGKIFALRADEVRMPGGGTARREVVEHFGAVAVLALDDDGSVVLIHQYRHPFGRRLWELPAGLLDFSGEPPHQTAARELAEEVGLAHRSALPPARDLPRHQGAAPGLTGGHPQELPSAQRRAAQES